jgi:hypothetical protein
LAREKPPPLPDPWGQVGPPWPWLSRAGAAAGGQVPFVQGPDAGEVASEFGVEGGGKHREAILVALAAADGDAGALDPAKIAQGYFDHVALVGGACACAAGRFAAVKALSL